MEALLKDAVLQSPARTVDFVVPSEPSYTRFEGPALIACSTAWRNHAGPASA